MYPSKTLQQRENKELPWTHVAPYPKRNYSLPMARIKKCSFNFPFSLCEKIENACRDKEGCFIEHHSEYVRRVLENHFKEKEINENIKKLC